jgi:hypothetical protein
VTDKPEIKVGQRWVTRGGDIVRILSTDAAGARCIVGQAVKTGEVFLYLFDGLFELDHAMNLRSRAPTTVKREVALYRYANTVDVWITEEATKSPGGMTRISHPIEVEFTLLDGEEA